jgi:hypothetical protein
VGIVCKTPTAAFCASLGRARVHGEDTRPLAGWRVFCCVGVCVMDGQGRAIRLSLSHRPGRTGHRARLDPANMPPSSRELQARRARYWAEILGNEISTQMHHS